MNYNMTAEDKAKELIEKYKWINYDLDDIEGHKEAAIIAVDEIIQLRKGYFSCENPMNDEAYWQEVKTIITNY